VIDSKILMAFLDSLKNRDGAGEVIGYYERYEPPVR
jgi:hypothetical protein